MGTKAALDEQKYPAAEIAELYHEVLGLAIAYNLVRHEMEAVAQKCRVAPTRISFRGVLAADP